VIESLHHLIDREHECDARRERPPDLERIVSAPDFGQLDRDHRECDAGSEVLDAASDEAARRTHGCRGCAEKRGADRDCGNQHDLKDTWEHADNRSRSVKWLSRQRVEEAAR